MLSVPSSTFYSKAESCGICGALCPYTHSIWAAAVDKSHFHVGTLYHWIKLMQLEHYQNHKKWLWYKPQIKTAFVIEHSWKWIPYWLKVYNKYKRVHRVWTTDNLLNGRFHFFPLTIFYFFFHQFFFSTVVVPRSTSLDGTYHHFRGRHSVHYLLYKLHHMRAFHFGNAKK